VKRLLRFLATGLAAALVGSAALAPQAAEGASAVLSKDGTLHEVFPTTLENVDPSAAGTFEARQPVLALRITPAGGEPHLEIVNGTLDPDDEWGEQVEYDESTHAVFVAYTKSQGFYANIHFAARTAKDTWFEGGFLASPGLYFSMNPRLVVTRQKYSLLDPDGERIEKWRSILSIVWWEATASSQGRIAFVFLEDGEIRTDDTIPYNLNDLVGSRGRTLFEGLPLSSYAYPAIQRDPKTNGGVLVSFADLVNQKQVVVGLTFPDDLTSLPASLSTSRSAFARGHNPIGRTMFADALPVQIDTAGPVATSIAPTSGMPVFHWTEGSSLRVLRGDAVQATPIRIPLRADFPLERAVSTVRDMAEKE